MVFKSFSEWAGAQGANGSSYVCLDLSMTRSREVLSKFSKDVVSSKDLKARLIAKLILRPDISASIEEADRKGTFKRKMLSTAVIDEMVQMFRSDFSASINMEFEKYYDVNLKLTLPKDGMNIKQQGRLNAYLSILKDGLCIIMRNNCILSITSEERSLPALSMSELIINEFNGDRNLCKAKIRRSKDAESIIIHWSIAKAALKSDSFKRSCPNVIDLVNSIFE